MLLRPDHLSRLLCAAAAGLVLGACGVEGAIAPDGTPGPSVAAPPAGGEPSRPEPSAFASRAAGTHLIARVRGREAIPYATGPSRPLTRRLKARTRFGTRRALSVVRERDGRLGVAVEDRPNGRLAWIEADSPSIELVTTPLSLHADLSRRRVELRSGRRVVRSLRVGVGRRQNRTPTGRYAVTDRLSGRDFPDVYGCCILALTGHQTRVPAGWKGGDRLAIHGTNAKDSFGRATSSGCLRAPDAEIRRLMRTVPIGTPVFVRR